MRAAGFINAQDKSESIFYNMIHKSAWQGCSQGNNITAEEEI